MLEAQHISVSYGSRKAIAGISLSPQPGEIVAIIGPNGAGKSTFLRALNGAHETSDGEVLLNRLPIRSYARRVVARHIAVVAQEAELQFPISVMEFVLGGRYALGNAWGWEGRDDIEIAHQVARETELEGFESRLMNQLSGGERQRAVLARALATEAKIYLLDEPTANLDLAHQATMLRLVRARCRNRQSTAVIVTHDLNLAAEFADRVMLLKDGSVLAIGSPHEVLTTELLAKVFDLKVFVDAHPVSGAPRVTPVHEEWH